MRGGRQKTPQDINLLSPLPYTRPTGLCRLFLSGVFLYRFLHAMVVPKDAEVKGTRDEATFCGAWNLV